MSYHDEFEDDDGYGFVPFKPEKKKKRREEPCGRGHSKPCCTFTGGGDADEETHD